MSFDFNEFKLRIEGESGLLFEFLKLPLQEEHWQYHNKKKGVKVWQIWDRKGFSNSPQILGLYVLFLFMTIYKIVDQVFEQILEDNGKSPRRRVWTYQEKINEFRSIHGKAGIILPKLFHKYPKLLNSLFEFYHQKKEARNAIAHRRINIIASKDFFVNFEDVDNSQKYDLSIYPSFISEKYFLIRALTEDFPEFSVINFKRIIDEISNAKDQRIKTDKLVQKLGSVYEIEIKWFFEKLIKNGFIELNKDIVSIKSH